MAVEVRMGSFALSATADPTTQVVSFSSAMAAAPAAIIFWGSRPTTDGWTTGTSPFFGFATSSTERACYCMSAQNALTTTQATRAASLTHCIYWYFRSTNHASCDINTWDTDGFTLDIESGDQSARKVHYLAITGCSAKITTHTQPTDSTPTAFTGVGFTPKLQFILTNVRTGVTIFYECINNEGC